MEEAKKILIIDDDPNILEIYGTKLRSEGFNVVTTDKSTEGIEIVKSQRPDLILLDILMPEKNGIEVLKEIKGNPDISRIPVMILSNNSDESVVKEISKFPTSFYAIKSMTDPKTLVGLVKEALFSE